jgi:predicted small secreted protein
MRSRNGVMLGSVGIKESMMMNTIMGQLALVLLVGFGLSACETVKGAGEDLQDASTNVQNRM